MSDILVIDDEMDIRSLIAEILKDEGGYSVSVASNAGSAIEQLAKTKPKVVLLDIWLEGSHMDGIGVLKIIKQKMPHIPVIMISGHGNVETAIQTIKLGAYDFIEKPFKTNKLLILVKRAIEASQMLQENFILKKKNDKLNFIGKSQTISHIRDAMHAAAPTNSRILITGESGTGKATIAQMIHNLSNRKNKNFVTWNTSNKSSETLMEELLGRNDQFWPCLLEQAEHGTLFIAELTYLPIDLQTILLHILQSGFFTKPGNSTQIPCDIRIIAASSKDLLQLIKVNKLNESLYYRINIVRLDIPPLRDRKEDIELLSEYFIKMLREEMGASSCRLSHDAHDMMMRYNWPGNIRQLKNAIEWMMIVSTNTKSEEISKNMLPSDILYEVVKQNDTSLNPMSTEIIQKPIKEARDLFEKGYIKAQLAKFNNNIAKTASFIGMDRAALHRKVKNLDL